MRLSLSRSRRKDEIAHILEATVPIKPVQEIVGDKLFSYQLVLERSCRHVVCARWLGLAQFGPGYKGAIGDQTRSVCALAGFGEVLEIARSSGYGTRVPVMARRA